ncbi:O-antigen ligase family protein [Winogradskyella sp.]|uniref:O-antigen ligase family protein n=1 Tax=Winogradskyella sp. TaxID=1883156 RepID=UPI0035C7F896
MTITSSTDIKKCIFKAGFFFITLFELLPFNIESYGVFVLILLSFLFYDNLKIDFSDFKLVLFFSFFYLIEVISLVYSDDLQRGINVVLRRITFFLMPIAFLLIRKQLSKKFIRNLLNMYVFSLFVLGIFFIAFIVNFFELYSAKLISLSIESWNFKHSILSNFYREIHPTYMSMAFLLGNLILVLRAKESKNKSKKTLYVIGILFFTLIIFIVKARIVILTTLIISPVYILLIYRIINYRKLFLISLMFSTSLAVILIFSSPGQKLHFKNSIKSSLQINDQNISRLDIYQASFDVIEKNLLFGVGTGDAKKELINSYKEKKLYKLYRNQFFNTHNQYLHYFLSGGLFSFLFFIVTFIYLLFLSIKSSDHLFFSFLFIIIMVMLTENIFNRINGIFFFSLFSSIFYYRNLKIKEDKNEE